MDSNMRNDKPPSYEESARPSNFFIFESSNESEPISNQPPPSYTPRRPQRWQFRIDRYLAELRFPLSLIAGAGITAGTAYILVKHVLHIISNAQVSSDAQTWMQETRAKDYEPCYLGCNDCDDPSFAYDACIRTSEIHPGDSSVICDGRRIWNWLDRYPAECLSARGEYYRQEALEGLKRSYRNRFILIILTVLAGVLGAWAVYWAWSRMTAKNRRRARETARNWPGWRESRVRVRAGNRTAALVAGLLALCARPAAAYPCAGRGRPHDLYLANANRTVFASVHSWLSNCRDEQVCTPYCVELCSKYGCPRVCAPSCRTETVVDKEPVDYAFNILPRIAQCGFSSYSGPFAGVGASLRVANPGIEKDWWVKVSVSGYNVTDPLETDPEVLCLHDIGGPLR